MSAKWFSVSYFIWRLNSVAQVNRAQYSGVNRIAYTEFLSSLQKEATASEQDKQECLKRAKETESLQQKQADITKKQKDAEKLISEANDRLLKAAANQNTTDLMAAQALLQSGTKMLVEARGEQDGLKEPQQHNKKTENWMNVSSDFVIVRPLCYYWTASYIVQYL